MKNQYRRWELQFADLRGAWQEGGGGVFEGGLIPQCTLCRCYKKKSLLFQVVAFKKYAMIKMDITKSCNHPRPAKILRLPPMTSHYFTTATHYIELY